MDKRTAMFRQLAKSGTKCFRRASQRPATKEYVPRRFQVGYGPKACVDIAGRVVSRLEQIVLDQDVFAQSFDSSVFRSEWIYVTSWLRGEAWQSDLSFQPARETWGHASQSAEVPSKVTLVGKTDGQRDLGQWQLSVTKQMSNMFEASLQQIAVRWRSN